MGGNSIGYSDPLGLYCFDFDKFSNQIEQNRANNALTLGSLISTLSIGGPMSKTNRELRALGISKKDINPYTSQLSCWSSRFKTRTLRVLGRKKAFIFLGAASSVSIIFEGFYDWGVIGKSAWDSTSMEDSNCGCK